MKVFKYLGSKVVVGSFAVVLLGGLPLAAAQAEDGSERLGALHADRVLLVSNVVSQSVRTVGKEQNQTIASEGTEQSRKFYKPRKGAYSKVRGR